MKMRRLKKAAVLLFSVFLLVSFSAVAVSADEPELEYGEGVILNYGTASIENATLSNYSISQSALQYAVGRLRASSSEIKLYQQGYRIKTSDVTTFMQACRFEAPDVFYMSDAFSYSYSGSYVYSIYPQYTMSGSTLTTAQAQYEQMITHITDQAGHLESDLEIALFYHEYIVANFEYDTDYTIYDAYNMLLSGKGVCQGYTLLYTELLDRAGIDNVAVLSNGLVHVWNAVEIGGEWFLADLTWDDPLYEVHGRVDHSYFLRSMGQFGHLLDNGTRDWVVADGRALTYSTRYDDAVWLGTNRWVHVYEGDAYYMTAQTVSRYDLDDGTVSAMFTVSSNAYLADGRYYADILGFCGYGDKLYYAESHEHGKAYIWEYDIDLGENVGYWTYTHSCTSSCVSTCAMSVRYLFSDDNRIYFLEATPNYETSGEVWYIEVAEYSPEPILMDVDGDGYVTNSDISLYVRYLSGWDNIGFVTASADVNGDGKYNNRDLIAIIKKVNG